MGPASQPTIKENYRTPSDEKKNAKDQSILAWANFFGAERLFDRRTVAFLFFDCFFNFRRATITGTEECMTR